ncbi:venom serine protease Bi-VSP-like [Eupeodes corollae]|uniref:venom serine protease Bi-VSP-like n=1 Tax=Eupeodes corollae TaxID=290404 RepID=UPI00248FB40E|nr:venom serine protease Bi-VSP-like [Eupeodes corollae]
MMCVLIVIVVPFIPGIVVESKSQNCVDSLNRPGNCIPVSGCPYLIEEFYEQARKFPDSIDFQNFISQSLCGFDGFRFSICCTIRSNNNVQQQQQLQQQQAPQQDPWYGQQSSTLFQFSPLGNQIDSPSSPAPIQNSVPITQPSIPQMTTQNMEPIIIAPVPGQPSVTIAPQNDLIVINPIPGDQSSPFNPKPSPSAATKSMNPPASGECGVSNKFTNRVVGGLEARKGAYPWMAALGYIEATHPTVLKFLCSGSLVSKTYVITAAHCLNPSSLVLVRLGAHDLTKTEASAVDVRIKRQIAHEQYNLKSISNDIALLQLNAPVSFTEFISPICLPEDIKFMQQDFVGNNPFVAGWGTVKFQGAPSNVLREAQVPIIETETCLANYSTKFKPVAVTNTLICAGNYITDACQGDSGGPLMMPQASERKFHYYVIGLVSYGYECARAGFPGVYTRVASYMQWIKNNMT